MSLLWLSPSYSSSKPSVQMDVPWAPVPALLLCLATALIPLLLFEAVVVSRPHCPLLSL